MALLYEIPRKKVHKNFTISFSPVSSGGHFLPFGVNYIPLHTKIECEE